MDPPPPPPHSILQGKGDADAVAGEVRLKIANLLLATATVSAYHVLATLTRR